MLVKKNKIKTELSDFVVEQNGARYCKCGDTDAKQM